MPEEGDIGDIGPFGNVLDGDCFVALFQDERDQRIGQKLVGAFDSAVKFLLHPILHVGV